ncbi:hypothetical protein GHT06_007397 [Daphnia sinensis]|uniref:histidine kinase n=1 Tax=Daphnia sinensis TaxID=1820382 RepID=A0AAD5PN26_9CRUS|nr:hypothetical protein GHT06_007397 [Daphnia sinensis]
MVDVEILRRRYEREREARKCAETILEKKSLELFRANQDLVAFNESLEHLVAERTKALETSESRLQSLICNLSEGVLLENQKGEIVLVNQGFCEIFKIECSPQRLVGGLCADALELVSNLFLEPQQLVNRTNEILREKKSVSDEQIKLADGRILNRDYVPIFIKSEYFGHLWKYRDVTNEVLVQEKLRASEDKYRGIIENMELGLMEVDNEGRIVTPYPRFCEMVGYEPQELIGQVAIDIFLPKEFATIFENQSKERNHGRSSVYEIQIFKKGGERIWVLISGVPIFDLNGRVTGTLGIHYDITHQKKLQNDLELARQKAEAAQEAEKQFLANMSHEIRTPLNAIIGMSHLLHDTHPTPEQKEYLTILKNSAEMLRMLISDVLDISKIRSGMVRSLAKSVQLRLQDKPISITTVFDERIENTLIGDDLLLNQILTNLIGNAEKFTAKGTIGISVKLKARVSEHYLLEFRVSDTGIGIPEDKVDLIFQTFRQVDGDIKRKFGGTGLGLSITKQLVELQGGSIEVESKLGEGSTFIVSLPYKDSGNRVIAKEYNIPNFDKIQVSDKKILVIEDNFMNRKYISTLLTKWGLDFSMAHDGKEGVEAAKKEKFDLIFMDIQMPIMDGYESTIAIRNSANPNVDTCIIALTASAMLSQKDKAFQAGMTDYLSKPFTPEQLMDKLQNNTQPSISDDLNTDNTEGGFFQFNPRLDAQLLDELYANEWDYVREMFKIFIENSIPEYEQLQEAFIKEDYEEVRRLAHKLKPTFGMVGLPDIEKKMLELENAAKAKPEKIVLEEIFDRIEADIPHAVEAVENDFNRLRLIEV